MKEIQEINHLAAVTDVESNGILKPIIQYEGYYFDKLYKKLSQIEVHSSLVTRFCDTK